MLFNQDGWYFTYHTVFILVPSNMTRAIHWFFRNAPIVQQKRIRVQTCAYFRDGLSWFWLPINVFSRMYYTWCRLVAYMTFYCIFPFFVGTFLASYYTLSYIGNTTIWWYNDRNCWNMLSIMERQRIMDVWVEISSKIFLHILLIFDRI